MGLSPSNPNCRHPYNANRGIAHLKVAPNASSLAGSPAANNLVENVQRHAWIGNGARPADLSALCQAVFTLRMYPPGF